MAQQHAEAVWPEGDYDCNGRWRIPCRAFSRQHTDMRLPSAHLILRVFHYLTRAILNEINLENKPPGFIRRLRKSECPCVIDSARQSHRAIKFLRDNPPHNVCDWPIAVVAPPIILPV